MDTYSAVVTTGIYCRPDCSARPHRDNVRPFAHPAAAEAAGFRACLRCRPYRSSELASVAGSALVCRAVRLLVAGALDDGTEADLAAHLGVSARHLRRRFVAEVGVTPDGLARSRRAHFARRLLDDTDLSVTEVAFAAGFGSVRQFNRVLRDVFRATPAELRARRRRTDRLVADGGLALRVPYEGPFDHGAFTRYLGDRAIPGVEVVEDATYRRTIVVDGHPGVLEVAAGDADHLQLTVHLPRWEGLIHLVDRVRRLAGVDAASTSPARALAQDPIAGPLLAAHPGTRPVGVWDPFEVGVRAILGQQVSVAGATTLAGRLVERFGAPVAGLGPMGLTHTFPSADGLADADIAAIGLPGRRAAAIRGFARAVADAQLRLDRSVELPTFVAQITAIPGLGPWTANYLALRLGEPDAFPASDLGLRRAVARHLGGVDASAVTPQRLESLAEAWRPWRAAVAARLWMNPPAVADPAGTAA